MLLLGPSSIYFCQNSLFLVQFINYKGSNNTSVSRKYILFAIIARITVFKSDLLLPNDYQFNYQVIYFEVYDSSQLSKEIYTKIFVRFTVVPAESIRRIRDRCVLLIDCVT